MNKTIKILLSAVAATTLVACTSPKQGESCVTIANPFEVCDTLEDAEKLAGFEMTLPESISGYDEPVFLAVEGEMIQAMYYSDDGDITIRKSNVENEDISGDYNDYAWETSYTLMNSTWEGDKGCDVTLKGDMAEKPYHATWSHDGYSYSIVTSDAYSDIPTLVTDVE